MRFSSLTTAVLILICTCLPNFATVYAEPLGSDNWCRPWLDTFRDQCVDKKTESVLCTSYFCDGSSSETSASGNERVCKVQECKASKKFGAAAGNWTTICEYGSSRVAYCNNYFEDCPGGCLYDFATISQAETEVAYWSTCRGPGEFLPVPGLPGDDIVIAKPASLMQTEAVTSGLINLMNNDIVVTGARAGRQCDTEVSQGQVGVGN